MDDSVSENYSTRSGIRLQSTSKVTEPDLKAALDRVVRDGLPSISIGLSALYAVFAVGHALLLPKAVAPPMITAASVTSILLLGFYLAARWRSIPIHWAHPIGASIAGLSLLNCLLHLYLAPDPHRTTNLMLLVIGAGYFLLSGRWLALVIAATLAGWGAIAPITSLSPQWVHFGFALLTSTVLSILICNIRIRTFSRLERMRIQEEQQKLEIEQAMKAVQQSEEALRVAHNELEMLIKKRTAELAQANEALQAEIVERKRAEEFLRIKTEQLQIIADAMTTFLQSGDWQRTSSLILRGALSQTESEYGFAGVIVEGPVLRILAHEGSSWDPGVNRGFYEQAMSSYREVGYLEFTNLNNLFGKVIIDGKAVLSNDPQSDPRSGGLPPGHPPMHNFLGVPIIWRTEMVGIIAVANRAGGYTVVEQSRLELLSQMAAVLYDNYRRLQREALLEEQLRQSQKIEAIGRLAGGVAHDFNNLLTVITGHSELILSCLRQDDPLRKDIKEIKRASERAASLTRQLLAFSRRQVLQPKVLNLNSIVADMDKMLRRLIGEDIDLVTILSPALWRVKADPGQIQQVILNLAINARDAMPGGGRLTIETANVEVDKTYSRRYADVQPGPYVMLTVSDTGCGMDEETRAHIFEPFFTTKEQGKGTGLGLSTAYGIIKQSEGFIEVQSEPNRGSVFKIYLPRVAETVESSVTGAASDETSDGLETILLVEDEAVVRALILRILQMSGYNVLEAGNGSEALAICERHKGAIDLVLTDMIMSKMTGWQLFERLKQLRPEVKVLFMSGCADNAIDHKALSASVAFIEKPFTPDAMIRKVREVLDQS